MAELNQIYRCEICGNIAMIVHAEDPNIVCCGKEMKKLEEKTAEQEGKEKHVPMVEIDQEKVTVRVGTIPHPMEEKHWIQFIQLLQNGRIVAFRELKPGEQPEATFNLEDTNNLAARELCNVHGLWKG